ncbi:hypothetical protein T492DRAFT_876543 [Pavlovales sp. CCMP2436]|nr:hypothetical protein T492DRAFT_876543 [Pavlovales sp. CCMP2436]|mmetsp:Transcript_19632/g.45934  ORF Transcript_19632/g.45934 Transcript_19632/m.45934 type:complete len:110 (+) Transcript_19632:2411-2740(+)
MVDTCSELLDQIGIEGAIRVGDIFALMVEWFASQRDYQQAYQSIQKMRARNLLLAPYLDSELIDAVYRAVGVEPEPEAEMARGPAASTKASEGEVDDDNEAIDDEVEDD